MTNRLIFILLFSLTVFTACGGGKGKIGPADIHYGEDLCAECNMIISDPRFASSYSKQVGDGEYETLAFDEIGNMLLYASKHPEDKVVGWFVHDYETEEWIDATAAFFVVSEQIKTPMNYGIVACAEKAAAEKLANELAGELLTWDELRLRPIGPGSHDEHQHEGDSH